MIKVIAFCDHQSYEVADEINSFLQKEKATLIDIKYQAFSDKFGSDYHNVLLIYEDNKDVKL